MITVQEVRNLVRQFRRKGVDIAEWSLDTTWSVTLRQGDNTITIVIKADEEDASIEHLRDLLNWQLKEWDNEQVRQETLARATRPDSGTT